MEYNTGSQDLQDTVAHEAGHQLDWIYGNYIYGFNHFASDLPLDFAYKLTGMSATISAGGGVQTGDQLFIYVAQNGSTVGTLSLTVKASDTTSTIATALSNEVSHTSGLTTLGVVGSSSGANIKLTSPVSLSFTQLTIPAPGHSSAAEVIELSSYDWPTFNSYSPQCGPSGIFSGDLNQTLSFICQSQQAFTVGGTPHPGDTLTVTFMYPNGSGTTSVPVSYNVPMSPTPTTTSIAAGLVAQITAQFSGAKFTASSSGAVVTTEYSYGGTPTYTTSVSSGSTETLTAGHQSPGYGPTLNSSFAYSGGNDKVLQAAWSTIFTAVQNPFNTTFNRWSEIFAEETSIVSSNSRTGATAEVWLKNFACSRLIVQTLESYGRLPMAGEYSTACQ